MHRTGKTRRGPRRDTEGLLALSAAVLDTLDDAGKDVRTARSLIESIQKAKRTGKIRHYAAMIILAIRLHRQTKRLIKRRNTRKDTR